MTHEMSHGTFALLRGTASHCIPFHVGGSWPGAHLREYSRLV